MGSGVPLSCKVRAVDYPCRTAGCQPELLIFQMQLIPLLPDVNPVILYGTGTNSQPCSLLSEQPIYRV